VVDVVAAQAAHQLAGQEQLFHRAVRAGQYTDTVGTVVSSSISITIIPILQMSIFLSYGFL
jgi:hypothetical protein